MSDKSFPCSSEKLLEIAIRHGTPFHLYSEAVILQRIRRLNAAFARFSGFREYFAVKAMPTPKILQILHAEKCGMDASSLVELLLCERLGITGENIMFTSNGTQPEEFRKAASLGAIINLDDEFFIESVQKSLGHFPDLISFRINPGKEKTGNSIIGDPVEAKFGITLEQVLPAYKKAQSAGATRFGIHAMTGSNMLDEAYFPETAAMLAKIAADLWEKLNIRVEFINIGGGFGIPYHPEQRELDIERVVEKIEAVFSRFSKANAPRLFMENGRWVTGPAGWLITKAVSRKETYKKYVAVDASMVDLMRPGMYGAYHHISVLNKENVPLETVDITGSLCENNDKFCVNRKLPRIEPDDLVVIHDTGAHGRAMGFNYNGKLRCKEVLLKSDGTTEVIRREETPEDYFSTMVF